MTLHIVAAVIIKNGRVLIGKRPMQKAMGGFFEFPGGKIEPEETVNSAIIRECKEELGIELVLEEFPHVVHLINDHFHIRFIRVRHYYGIPTLIEHDTLAWVRPDELYLYDLAPHDRQFANENLLAR